MLELKDRDTFFTSDLHFNHKNVIAYDNRPFCCVNGMNMEIIKNINLNIKPNQTLIMLGDIGFGKQARIDHLLSYIACKKWLVLGNHDRSARTMLKAGFEQVFYDLEVMIDSKEIYLSHVPDTAMAYAYDYHLHGHVHTNYTKRENMINVGCCVWDYIPRRFSDMVKQADERQANMVSTGHIEDDRDQEKLRNEIRLMNSER